MYNNNGNPLIYDSFIVFLSLLLLLKESLTTTLNLRKIRRTLEKNRSRMKTFRSLIQCLALFNCCHANNTFKQHEKSATTTTSTVESVSCAGESLSNTYLSGLTKASISNFIPSVYYNGGSAKFVTSKEGMTTLDHAWLCVNGSNNSGPIQLYDDGTNGDDVAGDGIYSR